MSRPGFWVEQWSYQLTALYRWWDAYRTMRRYNPRTKAWEPLSDAALADGWAVVERQREDIYVRASEA